MYIAGCFPSDNPTFWVVSAGYHTSTGQVVMHIRFAAELLFILGRKRPDMTRAVALTVFNLGLHGDLQETQCPERCCDCTVWRPCCRWMHYLMRLQCLTLFMCEKPWRLNGILLFKSLVLSRTWSFGCKHRQTLIDSLLSFTAAKKKKRSLLLPHLSLAVPDVSTCRL